MNNILYEGIHLSEPAELQCSICNREFVGRWWWIPEDIHFVACGDCLDGFEIRDEWPDMLRYGKLEQQTMWEDE